MEVEEKKKEHLNKDKTDNKEQENTDISAEEEKIPDERKIKEIEEKLLRALAEMENQRRRFEKEREEAFDFGGFAFAKESLALIDNLERAKISFTKNSKFKENKEFKKILEIFDILEKDLIAIFKRNNIEQIDCINKKFDPNLHQAMLEIDDTSKESGTVVQEIQKGYKMKDRLLRPSLVGVTRFNVGSSKKDKENKENNDSKK